MCLCNCSSFHEKPRYQPQHKLSSSHHIDPYIQFMFSSVHIHLFLLATNSTPAMPPTVCMLHQLHPPFIHAHQHAPNCMPHTSVQVPATHSLNHIQLIANSEIVFLVRLFTYNKYRSHCCRRRIVWHTCHTRKVHKCIADRHTWLGRHATNEATNGARAPAGTGNTI